MEIAFSIGINISEFWDMTPYELSIAVRGYSMRKKQEAEEYQSKLQNTRELMVEHAILLSRWVWKKQISKKEIEEALKISKKNNTEMTDDKMLEQAKALNIMFGGEVIR